MWTQKSYAANSTYEFTLTLFCILISCLIVPGCATQHQPIVKRPFIDFQYQACRPEYPRAALRFEQQGTVNAEVQVRADGTISAFEVSKSSGFPLLDDAVRLAILRNQCKAIPGTIDGNPTAMPLKLQYVWKLD